MKEWIESSLGYNRFSPEFLRQLIEHGANKAGNYYNKYTKQYEAIYYNVFIILDKIKQLEECAFNRNVYKPLRNFGIDNLFHIHHVQASHIALNCINELKKRAGSLKMSEDEYEKLVYDTLFLYYYVIEKFDENKVYTVAVPREKYALKQHIAFSYPQWKLIDCDSLDDAADMVIHEKADCFPMGASQALIYDNSQNFKSIPLTKTMEACFAVRSGEGTLLSILNKTLKAMPSDMLTSALAIYDSTADKVTFLDFVKDNMLAFFATAGFFVLTIISIILVLLRKARKAEAVAKLAANDTQKLNDKLEIALKKAEEANLAKTRFLNNMSHDIRTPMNAILGYAQLMENELKGKDLPETSEHLKKLQQSGNLLLSIINNVLDMARIESGRMEIDENYGRIEDIRQTLFEIFEDEAKKESCSSLHNKCRT